MHDLTDAIRSRANGKAVGPEGVSVELFKITLNGDPTLRPETARYSRSWLEGGEGP